MANLTYPIKIVYFVPQTMKSNHPIFNLSEDERSQNGQKTVVVGMSGGVDSSATAAILREQGYRVVGLFMKNWDEQDENGACTSEKDFEDVKRVCEKLDIPYYGVEFVQEYWDNVFKEFVRDYERGYTPNPDVLCNREIKFNVFLKKAKELGADYLATGHYAQKRLDDSGEYRLVKGLDGAKDQSYFLYTLKSSILNDVLFPIGALPKSEVREIARDFGLSTHDKKDSTGICFIGERNFRNFLSQYVSAKSGEFRRLDGSPTGTHRGAAFYTLGQRKGLGLGGEGERWYVVAKDISRNIVYVERGDVHPALYADDLIAGELTWVSARGAGEYPIRCRAKSRYRQADQDCTVTRLDDERVRVDFDSPQRALTPGQSVVFYAGDDCLGGGRIESVGPTYHEQGRALPVHTEETVDT